MAFVKKKTLIPATSETGEFVVPPRETTVTLKIPVDVYKAVRHAAVERELKDRDIWLEAVRIFLKMPRARKPGSDFVRRTRVAADTRAADTSDDLQAAASAAQ
jgi:hypothetical protein